MDIAIYKLQIAHRTADINILFIFFYLHILALLVRISETIINTILLSILY